MHGPLPRADASASGNRRSDASRVTVKVAVGLVLMKGVTFYFTGSSGLLGSALDSFFDVLASLLVMWAVLAAERPADAAHPWGHGKAEGLASLFQSLVILASGLGLAVHTIGRFSEADAATLDRPTIGIAVMVVSSAITLWLVQHLRRVARETGSPALEADSKHYSSDLLMNLGVICGLTLSWLMGGALWPDLLVGLIIALIILNTAREVFLGAISILMDRGLRPREAAAILRTVASFAPRVAGFHDLRTRRSGADVFLELHLDLDRELSFVDAHDLSEEVGRAIERALPNSKLTVHADPL